MAKTVGPLFSAAAHGSISKLLTYSERKSGQQVRGYNKPLKPPTPAQRGQRRLTEFLVAQWQNMSDANKATWATNARASGLNLSGYHYFLREAQRDLYTHHGLVGYWSFNEIVNNQVLDISGNALHGDLKPTPPADAPQLVEGMSTRFSKCLEFDGSNDYVVSPVSNKFDLTTNFSFMGWLKQTVHAAANKNAFQKHGTDTRSSYRMASGYWNTWRAVIAVGDVEYSTTPNINIGTGWNQLVGTYDGNVLLLYVNKVLRASNSDMSGAIDLNPAEPFYIGGRLGASPFPGPIDEVCIYNRLLSAAEIATRYDFAMKEV